MVTIHAGILIAVATWMLGVTVAQTMAAFQLHEILKNHLPHLKERIDLLKEKK